MDKREQIIDLLNKCIIGESVANTTDRILALFSVVGQSEQLVCPHQATRTPNEEKTWKCRQCGRKIKAN